MVESKQAHLQLLVFTFFLLYWHPTLIRAKEAEHDEFDYKEGSKKGPEHWGELKKEWARCKDGKFQSPIGLSDDHVTNVTSSLEDLKMSYKPSNATVKNEGPYLAIEWEGDAGSIKINGTDYFFKQCHWHTPSEHSINGIRYDLELHMVHQSTDPKIRNSIAVLAFLYHIGNPNLFLSKVNKDIMSEVATKEVHLGVIDPREIKWTSFSFYRYVGSLTSPPCAEGVIWTINEKVKHVSREQVELLQEAVDDYAEMNTRPLQPLNDREIKHYGLSLSDAPSPHEGNHGPKQYRSVSAQSPKESGSINAPKPSHPEGNQSPKQSLRLFTHITVCIFAYLL
ncbi:alpha carbonic anhydrase 4 [Prunus persica]|nr:alpha carbonic anhydrase 4 [Prunus persica]